jgi:hypothetical protein
MSAREQAIVSLKRIAVSDDPFTFTTIAVGRVPQRIRIPAGDYDVQIQLILDDTFIVPAQKRCEKFGVGGIPLDEECYIIPEVTFDQLVNGGFQEEVTIEQSSLYPADELRLFAVSPALTDIPQAQRVIEDLEQMSNIKKYSTDHIELLEPEYRQR